MSSEPIAWDNWTATTWTAEPRGTKPAGLPVLDCVGTFGEVDLDQSEWRVSHGTENSVTPGAIPLFFPSVLLEPATF